RDLVAGEGQAGEGVADGEADGREVTVAPGHGGHGSGLRARLVQDRPLVVDEEEQLVLLDGTAQRGAEDVLLALGPRGPGAVALPGIRVEAAVAVELEDVPLEVVGPGLDDVADDAAGHVADV